MSYADVILRDAPLGYWRLNESSGTQAADISGNGRHGTYTGSPTLGTASPFKGDSQAGAITLNGTSQYVLLNNAGLNINQPLSAECWLKTSQATGYGTLFGFHDTSTVGWALDMPFNGSGHPNFWNGAAWTAAGGAVVNDGAWHHLVATFTGGTLTYYLDAVQLSQTTSLANPGLSADTYHGLGAIANHSIAPNSGSLQATNFLNGSMAECAVYSGALTAGKVNTHYREAFRGGVVGP